MNIYVGNLSFDVTDPGNPSILTQDFVAFSVRSSFVWQNGDDAYVMLDVVSSLTSGCGPRPHPLYSLPRNNFV